MQDVIWEFNLIQDFTLMKTRDTPWKDNELKEDNRLQQSAFTEQDENTKLYKKPGTFTQFHPIRG